MTDTDQEAAPRSSLGRYRDVWVGLFVLLALVSGLSLIITMTDPAFLRGRYVLKTVVEDAGGIRKGDPVLMKGVVIGRIDGFSIEERTGKVVMELELERGNYRVPLDSRVDIRSKSIYGEMVADIIPGHSPRNAPRGGVISGRLVRDLFSGGSAVAQKAENVITRVQTLLSDENLQNVASGTTELQSLLSELNAIALEQRVELRVLSKSLRRSAHGIERVTARPELIAAIQRADAAMQQLQQVSASLDRSSRSLEVVIGRLEHGEGSLGKLLKNDEFHRNLNQTLQTANRLMADVRAHPNRYVKLSLF